MLFQPTTRELIMLTVVILICAMATPLDECTEKTAERVVVLPEHPVVCSVPTNEEFMASLVDMIKEGEEYLRIECRDEWRV